MIYEEKYKKPLIYFLIVVSILVIVCSLSTVSAANKTITTGDEGGIRNAINNNSVNSGDTVFLQPGIYDKTGNDTNFTINKNITLQGNGSTGSVIIDAKGMSRIFTMGGGINVIFNNIKFINGKATGNGGAILNNAGSTMMTFISCSFVNNTITPTNSADGKGGAIYNSGNYVTVANSSFINNKAENTNWYNGYGGAISNTGNHFTINNNSSFINNSAYDGGTIYNDYGNNFTVANSIFKDNNAIIYGGAIHNTGGINFIVANSTFTNNIATGIPGTSSLTGGHGGAISNSGPNFFVANSTFTGNQVVPTGSTNNTGGYGGAIMNTANNFTTKNSTFINNTGNFGAGIYNQGTSTSGINCTVTNSTFMNNTANSGAAIQNSGYNFIVNNTNFINNNAHNTSTNYGGAISNSGNYFTVANSTFKDNIGNNGGAIRNTGANFTVIDSNFTNNSGNNGGAIYNQGGANCSIASSTFTDNIGNNGGAIYNTGTNSTVSKSTFTGNIAKNNGGSIFNQGNMSVSSNTMTNNKATLGNMIYNTGNMGILNLTYLNNNTIKVVNGQNITLFATLTDDMGNTVTGQNISFIVNGINIGFSTSVEGNAIINYKVPDFEGLLPVSGNYTGHTNYQITLLDGQLRILIDTNSTINTPDNAKVGQKINITGIATDKTGNPIANTILNVIMNGKNYTVTTDNNGDWVLPYTLTQSGNIDVSVQWNGNESFFGFINSTNFNVEKSATNSTIVVLDNVKVGEDINITGVAKDEFDNLLVNTVLNVIVDNQFFTVTTNSGGLWTLTYPLIKAGNFDVSVSWIGNDTYYGFVNVTNFNAVKLNNDIDNNTDPSIDDNDIDNNTKRSIDDNDIDNSTKRSIGSNYTDTNNTEPSINTTEVDATKDTVPSINTKANMKKTGLPVILVIIALLSCIGFLGYIRIKN
ncbi:MAG: hypothetical protein FWE58_02595 [Methanobrevibacter sp.]|nr:hypothetical protein [Methanobrevibacter sp.]